MKNIDTKDVQINEIFLREARADWSNFKINVRALAKTVELPYSPHAIKISMAGLMAVMDYGDKMSDHLRKAIKETTGETLEQYSARLRNETKKDNEAEDNR